MRKLLLIAIFAMASLSANAQKVQVGADPGVDLSKYKTYNWAPGPIVANPIISQMIVEQVDAALTAKGLRKVDTDPEMTVAAFGSVDSDMYLSSPSWLPGLNSINTGVGATPRNFPVSKGTLVVDISDTKTKSSLWRGQSVQTLERGPTGDRAKDAKTVAKPIKKAIAKMFKQYPRPNQK